MGSPGVPRPSATARCSIHVLVHDPAGLEPVRHMLRLLRVTGWPTAVTAWAQPTSDLGPVPVQVVIPPPARRSSRALARVGALVGARRPPAIDPGSIPAAAFGADRLVCLDRVVEEAVAARAEFVPDRIAGPEALAAAVVQELAGRPVVKEGDAPALDEAFAVLPVERVDPAVARALCRALMEGSRWPTLLACLEWVRPTAPPGSVDAAVLDAYRALAELGTGVVPAGLTDRVGSALVTARAAEREGESSTTFLLALTLRSLFHRSLHVAVDSSPLIEDPATFLAPLREWPGLGLANPEPVVPAGSPGAPVESGTRNPARGAPRGSGESAGSPDGSAGSPDGSVGSPTAVLLPGAYPNFSADLAVALSASHRVVRVDLGGIDSRFRNTEVDAATLTRVWQAGTGSPVAVDDPGLAEAVATWRAADLVVADWADKGAALASLTVAPHTRLVVRVLGVDTLSAWMHVIDWSRVDAVVFVSEHLRAAARGILGPRLDGVEQHVVPHAVDVAAFPVQKSPAADRTLGMVGWAQSVKDPLWTLEVLAGLRAHDPSWRLRLIGADFPNRPTPTEAAYAHRFRAALDEADLREAVELTGFLTPAELAAASGDIGYAVSSSRRESWHMGAMELVASGAVPVVRDWPLYAKLHAAAGVFGPDAVVATPADAVHRILSVAEGTGGSSPATERRAARDLVRERYAPHVVAPLLREALLPSGR